MSSGIYAIWLNVPKYSICYKNYESKTQGSFCYLFINNTTTERKKQSVLSIKKYVFALSIILYLGKVTPIS